MSSRRIRKGDDVIVNTGKDRGRRGAVLEVLPNDRVLVEGLNIVKKHVRPNPNEGIQGGIEPREMPLHVSKVMLYNPQTGKGERVGFKWLGDGESRRKVRYFKSTGEVVDA